MSRQLIRRETVCPGAPHGPTGAHEQEFNADLLAFARA
jgi:non-heme chloroperoxidase